MGKISKAKAFVVRVYADVPDHYSRVAFWIVVFLGVPAFMLWLALKLWWFWRGFGLFGIALVVLLSWALLSMIFAATEVRRVMRAIALVPAAAPSPQSPAARPEKEVSWATWKLRTSYTLKEFANILACAEPSGPLGTKAIGYSRLLGDEISTGALICAQVQRGLGRILSRSEYPPSQYPHMYKVSRLDALNWADSKGINVSHIK